VITGDTRSSGAGDYDVYLIKTNENGTTQWTKTFGGSYSDWGSSVQQTSDGGYVITGTTYSFGPGDGNTYLIKTNSNGDTLWTKALGPVYPAFSFGNSVQLTTDGGYVIAGRMRAGGGGIDKVYVIKTNSSGDTLWTKTFGWGQGTAYSVQQTSDGGYIIGADLDNFDGQSYNVYLIKTNANGDESWTKTYGGNDYDNGGSAQLTTDGGYVIAGSTRSFGAGEFDFYLIKTNANGDTLWTKTFGGSLYDGAFSVQETSDGGYVIAGQTRSFGAGNSDVYLIKTDANGVVSVNTEKNLPMSFALEQNYPNPFNPTTTIRYSIPTRSFVILKVFNLLGQHIATLVDEEQPVGVYSIHWQASDFPSGVYLYNLQTNDFVKTKKLILLK
jgi:TolB-like protein